MSGRSSLTSVSEPLSLTSTSTSHPTKVSIKIYASCLRPDIEYKTLSVCYQTLSRDLIWQLLGKYKMKHRDPKLFYLTMDVVISRPKYLSPAPWCSTTKPDQRNSPRATPGGSASSL